jgi:DNA-binding SARP family transcriptional activator/tetratricopeptide (TPR) repeat protein
MPRIEIRLLGPFELLVEGRQVAVGGRQRMLLAALAMAVPRPVRIDTIGLALWGTEPPLNLRSTVHTYVARLRRLVGDAVVTDGDGYRLAVDADAVDALKLTRLCETTAAAPGAPGERDTVETVLALWRGRPFELVRSDWLTATYETHLTENHLWALERRLDLDLADGRLTGLVAELSALVGRYPLREPLWARLLLVLERTGRASEAFERYDAIRRRLADELGVSPSVELRRIHERLLATDGADEHDLAVVPRQLPSDIDRFTGRQDSLRALDALLPAGPGSRTRPIVIAAVHGTAGIGKTALAVHWAHRVQDQFPDGQVFVNLRGYGAGHPVEPVAALDTLLRSIGVPGSQIPDGLDARSAMLRSLLAGRRMLLVLDNARDSEQVRPLLPGATCQVLVTSRNQLQGLAVRDNAHRVRLEQLAPDESAAMLATRLRNLGVRYDEHDLAELAELCGHLPLALAVAAEHAGAVPESRLSALVAELRERRTRLDRLDLEDESTSVRAVFSWSYQALDPEAAACFRLLSLHPGPDFGSRSVAALTGTPSARAAWLLSRLADAHLVRQTGQDRYELHDLLRVYSAELCTATDPEQERDAALARVYDWYLHSSANARRAIGYSQVPIDLGKPLEDVEVAEFADSAEALGWLDLEYAAQVAAVRQAAARGQDRVAYLSAFVANGFLATSGRLDERDELQRIARDAAERDGDKTAIATSANQRSIAAHQRMRYGEAATLLHEALQLFEETGNALGRSTALSNLGSVLRAAGRYDEAVLRHRQAIEIAREMHNLDDEAASLNKLAMTYLDLHQYDEAAGASRRAIEIQRSLGSRWSEGSSLDTLGLALAGQGDHRAALAEFRQALAAYRETGDVGYQCLALLHIGQSQRALGDRPAARATASEALTLFDTHSLSESGELRRTDLVVLLSEPEVSRGRGTRA